MLGFDYPISISYGFSKILASNIANQLLIQFTKILATNILKEIIAKFLKTELALGTPKETTLFLD